MAVLTPRNPKSIKRFILRLAILSAVALLLIFTIDALRPYPSNPSGRHTGVIVDVRTDAMLRRACFDCHSNETRWPWYTRLPGVASLARWDVTEGRDELKFLRWDSMGPGRRAKALRESVEDMREGEMPPWYYILMHPDAAIDRQVIAQLSRAAGPYSGKNGNREHDEEDNEKGGKKDDG